MLVTLQRLGELVVVARHNTSKLLARGAIEVGAKPLSVGRAVHAAWLIALWIWGRDQDVNLVALAAFAVLQGFGYGSLQRSARDGPRASSCCRASRWSHRVPIRYLSHPNYAVVAGEIALLPLALHLPLLALVFTALNAAVLVIRIRAEARGLSVVVGTPARTAS